MTYVAEYDESQFPCSMHGTIWHTGACAECDQCYQLWVDAGRQRLAELAQNICHHNGINEDCPVCVIHLEFIAEDLRGDHQ